MKIWPRLSIVPLILLAVHAHAGVGYYNYSFWPGDNLFQNGLRAGDNRLSMIIPTPPEGTTISLWDASANAFHLDSVFSHGVWLDAGSSDPSTLELLPGAGAKLTTSAAFINTFVGDVLNHDGTPWSGDFSNPPPFSGPNGIYLLGDKSPVAADGTDIFLHILGRNPNFGEQITRLDVADQVYITSTWLDDGSGSGYWDILPSIGVGEAALFNIGPVPEPSAAVLGLLGLVLFRIARRK